MGEKHQQAPADDSGHYSAHFQVAAQDQIGAYHDEIGQHADAIRNGSCSLLAEAS